MAPTMHMHSRPCIMVQCPGHRRLLASLHAHTHLGLLVAHLTYLLQCPARRLYVPIHYLCYNIWTKRKHLKSQGLADPEGSQTASPPPTNSQAPLTLKATSTGAGVLNTPLAAITITETSGETYSFRRNDTARYARLGDESRKWLVGTMPVGDFLSTFLGGDRISLSAMPNGSDMFQKTMKKWPKNEKDIQTQIVSVSSVALPSRSSTQLRDRIRTHTDACLRSLPCIRLLNTKMEHRSLAALDSPSTIRPVTPMTLIPSEEA